LYPQPGEKVAFTGVDAKPDNPGNARTQCSQHLASHINKICVVCVLVSAKQLHKIFKDLHTNDQKVAQVCILPKKTRGFVAQDHSDG
jgi:hypothetical protein